MSFLHFEYIIPVLVLIILFLFYLPRKEYRFYKWVETYWFYKRSSISKISSALFLLSLILMMVSLLDLRGPEQNIQASVLKQETMILIDTSASMLAEDVRPNRFKKSLVLAKHFVRKAIGQHISVVVFSDAQKKIIPFTNDIDLIDARLSGLEDLDLSHGGTGLKLAIQESVQYFKTKTEEVRGNILIFTDAENNSDYGVVNIQSDINIAVVGVGTVKGATIPIRDKNGVFKGAKKYNKEEVISKLDEAFLKNLGSKIKNYKYWTASSYSLPTEEIISFFSGDNDSFDKKENIRIRPVYSNYVLIPAIIMMIISLFLKNFNTFILPIFFLISFNSFSTDNLVRKPEKTNEILFLEQKLREGSISENEKKKLANDLLKMGFTPESEKLYEEIISSDVNEENKNDYFNLAASKLKNKKTADALRYYESLYNYLKQENSDSQLFNDTKMNMLKALQLEKEKEKKKEEQKNSDKKDSEEKKNEDGDSSKQDKQSGEKDNKPKDKKEDKDNTSSNQNDNGQSSDKDNETEKKKDSNIDKGSDKKSAGDQIEKNLQDKTDKGEGKSKKEKLPSILKQLVNDDNQLQRKVIDAATNERQSGNQKDW